MGPRQSVPVNGPWSPRSVELMRRLCDVEGGGAQVAASSRDTDGVVCLGRVETSAAPVGLPLALESNVEIFEGQPLHIFNVQPGHEPREIEARV